MQPHTGAIVTVINFFHSQLKADESGFEAKFKNKSFEVRTTIYSASGSFLHYKYHNVKIIGHSANSKVIKFEVGKDYICYLEVRYNSSFNKFDFIKHRHTYVREEFNIYRSSENIIGEYVSESGHGHKLRGRKMAKNRVTFEDTFKDDKNPNTDLRMKYDFEIIRS